MIANPIVLRHFLLGFALAAITLSGLIEEASAQTITEQPAQERWGTFVIIPQTGAMPIHPRMHGVQISAVGAIVAIRDRVATTTIDVQILNHGGQQEEATVLLPVPEGSVVTGFAFDGASAEPTARLLPRDEARRTYESIVARAKDPALLEFAGWNLVRSSVFPVPAHGKQRVQLTYEHVLEGDGNRVDYILPRSESLSIQRPWSIAMSIDSKNTISTVYSPSHEIGAERTGPGNFTINLAANAGTQPGAFRVSYLLDGGGVTTSVFTYPDPKVGGGFFLMMAGAPARDANVCAPIKREVTLVLDRSGSMAGAKIDQVRAAALQIIEGLADGEAFNILDYSSTVAKFSATPVIKSPKTIEEARAYIAGITPTGGTNIHDALLEALRQEPAHDGMLPIVLFLTDGLATIGQTKETDIRQLVMTGNPHNRRVFTFGVGEDVNAPLLDRIASASRATASYVLPGDDVELQIARVFRRLHGPIFTAPELTVRDTSGAASTRLVHELIPDALPDLFDGDQLILLGQYRGEDPVSLTMKGNYEGEPREFIVTIDPKQAEITNAFVPRLWASRRIAMLIDEIRQAGAMSAGQPPVIGHTIVSDPRYQELIDEIVRLSTTYGILTEYTAFLATEGTDLGDWSGLMVSCSTLLDERAIRQRSGAVAVNQALNVEGQKAQAQLNYRNEWRNARSETVATEGVQQMCDRAFFRRSNRWIDSNLAIETGAALVPDATYCIGTPEYFEFIATLVRMGRAGIASLQGEVLLEVDGRVIRIIEDGC